MEIYRIEVKNEEVFYTKLKKIFQEVLENSKQGPSENKPSIPYIKVNEAMRILQVTRPTINHWVEKGFFKKYKVNSRTFFNRDEILEFLSKQGK